MTLVLKPCALDVPDKGGRRATHTLRWQVILQAPLRASPRPRADELGGPRSEWKGDEKSVRQGQPIRAGEVWESYWHSAQAQRSWAVRCLRVEQGLGRLVQ